MILNLINNLKFKLPDDYVEKANEFLNEIISELPDTLPHLSIVEHAEEYRVLPPGTPRPGPLKIREYTNYMTEPMEAMSANSIIQHIAFMKSAQIGLTMFLECMLCYYMDHAPADILFISATAQLLDRWNARRLTPALDSYGLTDRIYAEEMDTKTRRSPIKTYSKEYGGLRLDLASAQSAPALRSMDKKVLIRDEVDGCPPDLKNGEGNFMDVSYVRTNSHGENRKVCDVSTPTTFERSIIYKEYLDGDCRRYKVKCPHCEEYQFLEFEFDYKSKNYGIKPIFDKDGDLVDAVYMCAFCQKDIKNHHKTEMLKTGYWQPTTKSKSKFYRSYHINALYAPVGMIDWAEIYGVYKNSIGDESAMRALTNLYAGLPYRETGLKPKIEAMNELSGDYEAGTIPDGVLYVTAGGDIQAGANRWKKLSNEELEKEIKKAKKEDIKKPGFFDKQKFPRIEIEFLAHGIGYRTYSINYKIFPGRIDNIDSGAWEKLTEYYISLTEKSNVISDGQKEPVFIRTDDRQFPIQYTFIDAHDYANSQQYVYSYCEKFGNFFPCMGFSDLKQRKDEKGDEATRDNIKRYRLSKIAEDMFCVQISTNYFKTIIYNNANKLRNATSGNPPGFMDHPKSYGKKYFQGLFEEERLKDNSFHSSGKANEPLDCKVYAMCAGALWLSEKVKQWRDYYIRAKKMSRREVEDKITHIKILRDMERETVRKV